MAPKLKVAIVGAGIGGLMLASCIAQADRRKEIEVDIYEAAKELAEIGAGINIWPRVFEMLAKIGLKEDILGFCEGATADSSLAFEFRKSDQKNGHAILDLYIKGGVVRIHRADLQRIMLKHALTHGRLHLSRKLASYTEGTDSVHLEFMDGSKGTCDLLVGADGIKSTVRRLFLASRPGNGYQKSIEPIWTGSHAYRGIIPRDTLLKKLPGHRVTRHPVMYIGKLKHIVAYPMSDGALISVVALVHNETQEETYHEGPPTENVTNAEALSAYEGYEPEVQALLECIPNPSKWAVYHLNPLETYGERRVLLLGDAAHAMGPHQGAGAGQAMEDAYVLSHILTDADITDLSSEISVVTHVYDAIRRPIANATLVLTKTCGKLTGLTDDEKKLPFVKAGDETVPHEILLAYIKKLEHHWQWLWDDSAPVEDQRHDALKLLRGLRKPESKM